VKDHLGNTRLVLDSTGAIQSRMDYEPYGIELYPLAGNASGEKYKFTNQERDYTTGLDYMHARYYSSAMGRFMGADPINGNPANPQSWNLYAYVGNNPVNRNDPTGMYWEVVHELLTEYLALSIGLSTQQARELATDNVNVDRMQKAGLYYPDYKLHFMSESEAWANLDDPCVGLGEGLHPLADVFSHDRPFVFYPFGHIFYGTWVDNPSNDPQAAYKMIVAMVIAMGGDPSILDWATLQQIITSCKTKEALKKALENEIKKKKESAENNPEQPPDPPCPEIDSQGQQKTGNNNGANEKRLYVSDMGGGR